MVDDLRNTGRTGSRFRRPRGPRRSTLSARRSCFTARAINGPPRPQHAFLEISQFAAYGMFGDVPAASVIAGIGRVAGVECMIVANDATVKGGVLPMTVKKHLRAQEIAAAKPAALHLSGRFGGANLPMQDEVFPDRDHFGRIFFNQANPVGARHPQIAVVMGSCTAGGAYVPAMSDESIIVKNQGTIFLGGPPLVKAATGEGGVGRGPRRRRRPYAQSGVVDHLARTTHALAIARRIGRDPELEKARCRLALTATRNRSADELDGIIPTDPRKPYDVREVIARIVDGSRSTNSRRATARRWSRLRPHSMAIRSASSPTTGIVSASRREGRAFHRTVRPARHSARVPAEHHRLHGRPQAYETAASQGRRQDGDRGRPAQGAEFTVVIGGSFGAGNYGMCGRAYSPRFLWMGRTPASR